MNCSAPSPSRMAWSVTSTSPSMPGPLICTLAGGPPGHAKVNAVDASNMHSAHIKAYLILFMVSLRELNWYSYSIQRSQVRGSVKLFILEGAFSRLGGRHSEEKWNCVSRPISCMAHDFEYRGVHRPHALLALWQVA